MFTWETVAELYSFELISKLESGKYVAGDYFFTHDDCMPYSSNIFCHKAINVVLMLAELRLRIVGAMNRVGS